MALASGTRLGPYQIGAPLGVGGMGEVYRARDTKLGRDVAVKVLLPEVARDPDRLARFGREAQVLASLNHPNIAHIHGLEESDGVTALVMELVEGPTLADRIARGPMPLDEALPIAAQIAAALEAAHEQGIIHRDLKPANIKVRPDGTVKVLDFGLAKAFDPTGGSGAAATMSPTLSVHATLAGVILGTAAYMSPEQASGKLVDKRSDLWAFGVVLFEMLTGRPMFAGETISHVLASVLKSDPDWTALPPDTPTPIRRLLRRCLEKDRKRRLADASDARLEIEDALAGLEASAARVGTVGVGGKWPLVTVSVVAIAALVMAGVFAWRMESQAAVSPVYAALDAPAGFVLGEDDGGVSLPTRTPFVFTRDGRSLIIQAASNGKPQLFLRPLDRPDARPIAGTENARVPFVSPDGKWIGFSNGAELRKVPIEGGAPTTICRLRLGLGPAGAAWGADDTILFGDTTSNRIMRVPAGGGTPTPVTPEPLLRHLHVTPFFLPDGTRFLFADVSTLDASASRVMMQSINGGPVQPVIESATNARLLPSGQLAFVRLGTLMTVGFDATGAKAIGNPVAVLGGVMQSGLRSRAGANNTGAGMFEVSNQGHLAVIRGPVTGGEGTNLVWVTRDGKASSAEPGTGAPGSGNRLYTRVSPDQSRAIITVITPLRMERWVADWTRSLWTLCEKCGHDQLIPAIWAPDSRRVLFSEGETLVAHALDESITDVVVAREPDRVMTPDAWLPNGRIVYESRARGADSVEVRVLDPGANAGRVLVSLRQPASPAADASPDGRWLAYGSTESGQADVIVQPLDKGGPRVTVSAGGGVDPMWSSDGRSVYYLRVPGGDAILSVDLAVAGDRLIAGPPRELFRRADPQGCTPRCIDVAIGPRFLLKDKTGIKRDSVTRMDLVLNWTATLAKN